VTCACGRHNDARRSYCGGCGHRIGKACGRCQFLNATDDAFCGGCGDALAASAVPVKIVSDPPTAPLGKPALSRADTMSSTELASLLGKAAAPAEVQLPAVVSQDDLDRLFGGVS
jgi:hypothetical protein